MELKRVVVTGLGAITPLGNDVPTTWEAAKAGKSGAGPITHFDASKFKTQFACEVKNFNASEHITDRRKLRQLDLYAQYALVAAVRQLKIAVWKPAKVLTVIASELSWPQVSAVCTHLKKKPAIMPSTRKKVRNIIPSSFRK